MRIGPTWTAFAVTAVLLCSGCARVQPVQANVNPSAGGAEAPPGAAAGKRHIRATGTIQAVRAYTVQVPQITGSSMGGPGGGRITLIKLAPNGTKVQEGDTLAEFDRTTQLDAALEAKAKYDDLSHQVKEKEAKNASDVAKRSSEIRQAEADLAKAELQLQKGPVLAEIERQKNQEKADNARARLVSLRKSDDSRRRAEAAALEILKLQMERQKVALDRAQSNSEKLILKAPLAGMVALENLWRGGSMGNAQEGDQLFPGQALLRIFDPGLMEVRAQIGAPDTVALQPGATAMVYLDAYPDAIFKARLESASPVATAALGSPIKNFTARFRLEGTDPRLLPDLSAAVIVHQNGEAK